MPQIKCKMLQPNDGSGDLFYCSDPAKLTRHYIGDSLALFGL